MSRPFAASVLTLPNSGPSAPTSPDLISFSIDPIVTGVDVVIGTLGVRTDVPTLYAKTGSNPTDWTPITSPIAALFYDTITTLNPTVNNLDSLDPGTLGQNTLILLTLASGASTLKGVKNGAGGKLVTIVFVNITANTPAISCSLVNDSAATATDGILVFGSSSSSNSKDMQPHGSVTLYYDNADSSLVRWRTISVARTGVR